MRRTIFKDKKLDDELASFGYVKLKLFNSNEIKNLLGYFKLKDEVPESAVFYSTMEHKDLHLKLEIYEFICELYNKKCDSTFKDYQALFGNFIYKKANSTYKVGIHQDWTYVDETQFEAINIWTPLCKTSSLNGGLCVLPKSHLIPFHHRSTPFEDSLRDFEDNIRKNAKCLDTELGEVIVYNSKLIHFSNENNLNEDRVACACICIPKESIAMHFHKKNNTLHKLTVDTGFYLDPIKMADSYPSEEIDNPIKFNKKNIDLYLNHILAL
jgi:hypothetical protein